MSSFKVENRIWDRAETMPRERLAATQLQRLRSVFARVANVPFYKNAFERLKLLAEDVDALTAGGHCAHDGNAQLPLQGG